MAEPFRPNLPTNFNNGEKYEHGDGLQPETINQVVEAVLYVLGLTGEIQTSTDNGNTRVEIAEDAICYPRYKRDNKKGKQGEAGARGVGIASITNQYARSHYSTSEPTKWYDTPIEPTYYDNYAWIKQTITYTDGTTKEIKYISGVTGQKGATGADGDRGEPGFRFVSIDANSTSEEIYSAFGDAFNVEIPFGIWLSGIHEFDYGVVFLMQGASVDDDGAGNFVYTFCNFVAAPDLTTYKIVAIITTNHNPTLCSIETQVTPI